MEGFLLVLQALQVLFLWLHDWIPLPPLNDIAAVRSQNTRRHLVFSTLMNSVPFTFGLIFSSIYFRRGYPMWLSYWLCISYGVLFAGELFAWWVPYLIRSEPERAARYEIMFGETHSVLPKHNGLVPNTAHILLHLATAATLLLLFCK